MRRVRSSRDPIEELHRSVSEVKIEFVGDLPESVRVGVVWR